MPLRPPPRPTRPTRRALAWLALLGPSFYLCYGLANAWAASRAQVPSVVFGWERQIPLLPWTIVPYWSLNAFYALSLFLAPSRHALDRLGARLLTATLLACACFVLWPLHFSFGQPAVEGAPGLLFAALRGFDQPYNQAPSLHIALALILWDSYRRLLRARWARALAHLWTLAIGVSVLTTWQHHFIDLPTGALLGLLCIWLWPLERRVSMPRAWRLARDTRRWRLAGAYALGAAACLALALGAGGVVLLLGWPAAALALVALNYLGLGARGFQMDGRGRMAWAARWLFAPYRLGAALNAWLWTRRLPASVQLQPGLRLGRRPSRREWRAAGSPRLLSLCAELQLPPGLPQARCLPLLDLVPPTPAQLRRAAAMIEGLRRAAAAQPPQAHAHAHAHAHADIDADGASVWVCCALGFSRSAAASLAWLGTHGGAGGLAPAEAQVRRARPQMVLGPAWRAALAAVMAAPASPPASARASSTPPPGPAHESPIHD